METFWDFLLLMIKQFAGGPGPSENNLVRFGLAAVFWLVLLIVAWTRQKDQDLPREKLLVWGFGLALARELIMLALTIKKIVGGETGDDIYFHPLEHGLEIGAIVMVAGAFLRYVLNDERVPRLYIQISLAVTSLALGVAFITWPSAVALNPSLSFNETWEARLFHILSSTMILVAIVALGRKRAWLQITVGLALFCLFLSESLFLINFFHTTQLHEILCPIGNSFHLLAIPLFGFVYLKEMSIEKQKTEEKLDKYRDHLEELVHERTAMLVAQSAIAGSLSQSNDLLVILDLALEKVMPVLSMDLGLAFLIDRKNDELALGSYQGCVSQEDLDFCILEGCPYKKIAELAVDERQVISRALSGYPDLLSEHIEREKLRVLVGAPLIARDQIVGAITLGSRQAIALDQTNLALLAAVCHQVGMAIENAYLYQETEMWANGLSTLHQASIKLGSTFDPAQINREIVAQSIKLTARQAACILSWDQEQQLTCIASTGFDPDMVAVLKQNPDIGDLFDELCNTTNSIVIEDIAQDARVPALWQDTLGNYSLLGTPLWRNSKTTVLLFIMDPHKRKSWLVKDVELVESFVSRAAVALENAQLHKQLEWAAALEERQRIAANMHDGLAQTISLLGLKVDHAAQQFSNAENGELLAALGRIRDTVHQASVDVRKSIASLQNVPEPRKSLQELLNALIVEWAKPGDIIFDAHISFSAPLILPAAQIAQVTPILQEAMVNIRKHAKATHVSLYGEEQGNAIVITLEDDGIGFGPEKIIESEHDHFGIKIMQARAARLDASLTIDSEPQGGGTRVTLAWQLNDEADYRPLPEPIYEPAIFIEGEEHA